MSCVGYCVLWRDHISRCAALFAFSFCTVYGWLLLPIDHCVKVMFYTVAACLKRKKTL